MGDTKKSKKPQEGEAAVEEQLTLDALGAEMPEALPIDAVTETSVEETSVTEASDTTDQPNDEQPEKSVADISAKKKITSQQKTWQRNLGFATGALALIALVLSGAMGQYYKGRAMPGVAVAGIESGAKRRSEVKTQLEKQYQQFQITLAVNEKKLEPKLEEVGVSVDIEKTLENSLQAKRNEGLRGRLLFWHRKNIPAVISTNEKTLQEYIETNLPELSKPAQDSQLQFDAAANKFVITQQADGTGPNLKSLQAQLAALGDSLQSAVVTVQQSATKPSITQQKLQPLVEPANALVSRSIVLTGLGYTFRATPADIATWVTPVPQKDYSIKLVVDSAKIQSYIEAISKRIASPPQDQKVLKDTTTGNEVVIQAGRNGTELADRQVLANAIAQALNEQRDITQTMNIQTAAFQTVSMSAYDKWIEVDLSEQRTTAYEGATPIRSFIIASGMRGYETVTGEFAIWHKNRRQTMTGGSKADGSYYSIPNVEWVSYFYKDYALHGAWWREKFGAPASHGCVNMTNSDAQWIYEWAPMGTKVIVHQ